MKIKVVIIILYDCEKKFLLQHRSKDARLLPDYWAFFGGQIGEGEAPEVAVVREAYEELDYKLKSPQLIIEQDFKEDGVDGHMHVYIEYFTGDDSVLKLQEGQGWGWYKETEMRQLRMIDRDRRIINSIMFYLRQQ